MEREGDEGQEGGRWVRANEREEEIWTGAAREGQRVGR